MLADGEAYSDRLLAEIKARETEMDRELARMRAYDHVQDVARAAFARRPPRPGEPPRMDPATAWNWLAEARQEIFDEYPGHIPPSVEESGSNLQPPAVDSNR